jgi:mannose-6-phosphate isomerase-like protein (cupin superfamily)
MPGSHAPASITATAMAPDGIAIHTFDIPPAKLVGVAEGRIPTGTFSVHRHLTLEQYTYVVSGSVTAITSSAPDHRETTLDLKQGNLLLTLPGETLQFVNSAAEPARVLFICAPPYSPDDADTRLLEDHQSLTTQEIAAAVERLLELRADLNTELDARIAVLTRLLETVSP